MRRGVLLASVIAFAAARSGHSAPISIHLHGEQVDIHAEGVPLVQVLNGVAWEAKMQIVYDNAPPPQDPVSFDIKNATLSDAITELLRGHGLVYVAKMDAAGKRVDTLLLTTGSAGPAHVPPPGEPLPNGDPPMEPPPQEYTPEPPPMEVYQPPPTPLTPTAAPASAWTPQPMSIPSVLGGGAPPAATATPPPMMPGRMPGYQGHGYPSYTPAPPPPESPTPG